jgi:hypothetical protein
MQILVPWQFLRLAFLSALQQIALARELLPFETQILCFQCFNDKVGVLRAESLA